MARIRLKEKFAKATFRLPASAAVVLSSGTLLVLLGMGGGSGLAPAVFWPPSAGESGEQPVTGGQLETPSEPSDEFTGQGGPLGAMLEEPRPPLVRQKPADEPGAFAVLMPEPLSHSVAAVPVWSGDGPLGTMRFTPGGRPAPAPWSTAPVTGGAFAAVAGPQRGGPGGDARPTGGFMPPPDVPSSGEVPLPAPLVLFPAGAAALFARRLLRKGAA